MNGGAIDCIADTSAIIGLLRGDPRVEQQVSGRSFAITFITLAELSLGVLKAARAARRPMCSAGCYTI
jgi:predicted nucleic acid-binding protein